MEWIIGIGSSIAASVLILFAARAAGLVTVTARRRSAERKLAARVAEAGFTNLFLARADYQTYRGTPTVMGYLATARRSVVVIGYWMAQGSEIESLDEIARLILARSDFTVDIALVDPDGPHVESLAEHLGDTPEHIHGNCFKTLKRLAAIRDGLPLEARRRLRIKTYRSTAVASVIILDGDEPDGRIQLDYKPYRTPRDKSYGFELSGPGKPFYDLHFKASMRMLEDAKEWN